MPVSVMIPTPLRPFTTRLDRLDLAPGTLDDVLQELTRDYPDLRIHMFNDEGKLRSFINIYLNDEDVRYLGQGWAIENEHVRVCQKVFVNDGDVISIVPSIAGGASSRQRPKGNRGQLFQSPPFDKVLTVFPGDERCGPKCSGPTVTQ